MKSYSKVGFLLLLSSSVVVNGAPPRIFGNKNILLSTATTGNPFEVEGNVPEEELELESLKGHEKFDVIQPLPAVTSTSTSSDAQPAAVLPLANIKKPENEEKPALSDNANSLKFPHHNPGGIDEALLSKKSHAGENSLVHANQNLDKLQNHHKFGQIQQQLQQQQNAIGDGERMDASSNSNQNFQLDYTPQDIAEYVFWTGDEKGVAMAIGDFLQDGMVGREDAVRFLEDVKRELNSIRSRYSSSSQGQQSFHHNGFNSPQPGNYKGVTSIRSTKRDYSSPETANSFPLFSDGPSSFGGRQQQIEQNGLGLSSGGNPMSVEELDYDEIAEKLRTVDAKMREYALEDIIYQIGKDLFSESLKNSPGESTQKFSSFIEAQAANGRIPKDLEKDVLEVLVGAFVDAVDEHGAMQGNIGLTDVSQNQRHSQSSSNPVKSSILQKNKNGS